MGKQAVPDAWEDDWEAQADRIADAPPRREEPTAPMSRSQRLAQHAEANRKLWESADTPQTFHYIEASASANANVPVASTFKPQVKVLSRKPVIVKCNAVGGGASLLDDDDDDGPKKEVPLSPEEIRAKQKRDREEKQRRYEEARAKIFGESAPSSGASSPGTVTPPRSDGHFASRGRGRGRGGYRNNNNSSNNYNNNNSNNHNSGGGHEGRPQHPQQQQQQQQQQQKQQQPQHNQQQFENRQFDTRRPPNLSGSGRELYDPNSSPKPESPSRVPPVRSGGGMLRDEPPIRAPRGPDGSGRGGFGFAQRGAKES